MNTKSCHRIFAASLIMVLVAGGLGCSKKTDQEAASDPEFQAKLDEVIARMEATKVPYKGNLTPDKAAQITHEISQQNLAEFPAGKDLPKDPQVLTQINDRIRKKNEEVYAKHGTTMGEMMRYISNLSPKDREKYNEKLTELFLEESRKKYGTPAEGAQATPGATAQPTAPASDPQKKK